MSRPSTAFAAALFVLAACGDSAEKKQDEQAAANSVHVGSARSDTVPLREGDARIITVDGSIDLALIGDTISTGLSPSSLAKARHETDTANVKGSGLGASIERMVKSGVQSAIGTRIAFPVSDIKDARYEDGRIVLEWKGKPPQIFTNTKVNKRPLLESFAPADAERFVDAVNNRRGAIAR